MDRKTDVLPTIAPPQPPVGHRIADLPIGTTLAYELIQQGKLRAKKLGKATLVMNWHEYVASLPDMQARRAA